MDAFTWVEDSQALSDSAGPGTHRRFLLVLGCLKLPTVATQALDLSTSIPVSFHQHPALAGILVQTVFRMPTRTREAHDANF